MVFGLHFIVTTAGINLNLLRYITVNVVYMNPQLETNYHCGPVAKPILSLTLSS